MLGCGTSGYGVKPPEGTTRPACAAVVVMGVRSSLPNGRSGTSIPISGARPQAGERSACLPRNRARARRYLSTVYAVEPARPDAEDAARAIELRRFLRSRRARISPADLGLPVDRQRRAPGLRREDVAELAEISVGWYGQFELGRAPHVSARTVETIGRVLRLDAAEMAYLFRLSGVAAPAEQVGVPETVAMSAVESTLRGFTGGPAHVQDRYFDVIAVND